VHRAIAEWVGHFFSSTAISKLKIICIYYHDVHEGHEALKWFKPYGIFFFMTFVSFMVEKNFIDKFPYS